MGEQICYNCCEWKILILIKYWIVSLKRTRGDYLPDLLCLIEKDLGLYVSACILVFILCFIIVYDLVCIWLRCHETMYQQNYLEVFQLYLKKSNNECGRKECGTKEWKLFFAKLHLIRKLKFRIFNSVAIILYLWFRMLSYFRVIHNLQFYIFRKLKDDFVAESFNIKLNFERKSNP